MFRVIHLFSKKGGGRKEERGIGVHTRQWVPVQTPHESNIHVIGIRGK